MMKTPAILVLAVLAAGPQLNAQDITGSYSFTVCKVRCTGEPSEVIARGRFALFRDSSALNFALAEAAVTLSPRSRFYGISGGDLRACFVVTAREESLADRELYVGIHPSGKTTWQFKESEFSLKLYQSPDAWAHFIGRVEGETIVGVNRQLHCCGGGYMEVGHARAVKIGPPKAETCASN